MQEQKQAKPIPVKVAMAKVTIPTRGGLLRKTVAKTPEELAGKKTSRWSLKTKAVARDRAGKIKRLQLMHDKLGELLAYLDMHPNADVEFKSSDRDGVYAELVVMGHRLETQDEANKRAAAAVVAAEKQRVADEKKLIALKRTAQRRLALVETAKKSAETAMDQVAKLSAKLANK